MAPFSIEGASSNCGAVQSTIAEIRIEPSASANELMDRPAAMTSEVYGLKARLRTLQRRVGEWRSERAKEVVLGSLRKAGAKTVEHQ
jgi:hypothetical protein